MTVEAPGHGRHPDLKVRVAAVTHRGLVREGNEDAFMVAGLVCQALSGAVPVPVSATQVLKSDPVVGSGLALAVADGLGGHQAGELASRLALESLALVQSQVRAATPADAVSFWRGALERAHRSILTQAAGCPEQAGMGATVAGVHLHTAWGAVTFHAGDSRVYRFRQGILKVLTVDHSQAERGRLDGPFGTEAPREGSGVWKCLGCGREDLDPTVEHAARALHPGDRYLLATDGLSDMISHDAIEATLAARPGLRGAVETLLDASLAGGGHDNVTVILAEVTGSAGSAGVAGEEAVG